MACPARSLRSTSGSFWRRSKALLGLWGPPRAGTRVSPTTGCPLRGWDEDREAGDGSRVGAQRSLQYERSQWCRKSPWVLAQGFGTLQVTRGRCLVPPSPQHPWSHRTMGTARTPSPDLGDLGASIGTASGKREATGAASPCHKCHHLEGAGGAGCGPRCLPRVDLCAFGRVQRCCRAGVQGDGGDSAGAGVTAWHPPCRIERDKAFAHKKAERAAVRMHLRDKYHLAQVGTHVGCPEPPYPPR